MKDKIPKIVKSSHKDLPHFSDGRVDYSESEMAPTTVIFLKYNEEILLLKRSDKVTHRKNSWGVVAGYLDELKTLVKKALEEVSEETGITKDKISSIIIGEVYRFQKEETTFVSHPILMELKTKPRIELSWEHTKYKWVKIGKAGEYLPKYALEELDMLLSKKEEQN